MLPTDVIAVFQWWAVLLLIGVGFAPLTFFLFDKFFDKGYIFSKLLGILITGYVVFVLGVFKILPFSMLSIYIVFFILCIAFVIALPKRWRILWVLKRFWPILLIEEALFLGILFIWAYIHSFAPDIHGLEKFMDFGFVNSFLRSEYLPAKDMWFTPFTINYYYFGHLVTAMLTKMSSLPSAITFNLMLSTIVAFCFVQTFSIGANLFINLINAPRLQKVRVTLSGLLTAALVTFAGNLHILYAFFKPYKTETPVPFWQLQFNPFEFPNAYWYPNATRFIYNTIHEFPIYSWVVADLHGHVLDIPFVLLTIGLGLSLVLFHTQKPSEDDPPKLKMFMVNPFVLALLGLILACMYMTNAWDGAIYLIFIALILLYIHIKYVPLYKKSFDAEEKEDAVVIKNANAKPEKRIEGWHWAVARDFLLALLVVLFTFVLFTMPYNMNFSPFVSGIGVLCAPEFLTKIGKIGPLLFEANHCQRSYPWELLTLYGFFYFFVTIFAVSLYRAKKYNPTDIFVLILVLLSTFLIILPEFVYVKDIYPAHYRANTMFKLVFEAFIMLQISSAYIIVRTLSLIQLSNLKIQLRALYVGFILITFVLVYLVLTYPYLAVKAYYGDLKTYKGLNGVAYLQTLYPDDYAAITWLNANVVGQPVILEGQGDSYTDYGRISTNTGLPTVLGWTVHEWLWRGTYDIPAPRITEIKDLYETSDLAKANQLIRKYKIQYIIVGTLEYQKYPNLNETKFTQVGKVVFQQNTTKIYKTSL